MTKNSTIGGTMQHCVLIKIYFTEFYRVEILLWLSKLGGEIVF